MRDKQSRCKYCGTILRHDEENLCEECQIEAGDLNISEEEMISGPKIVKSVKVHRPATGQ